MDYSVYHPGSFEVGLEKGWIQFIIQFSHNDSLFQLNLAVGYGRY